MSVVVTLCLKDGIVMAADSRTTLTKSYSDGRREISHKDGIKKIFNFGNIGILWFGNARVGNASVSEYLTDLFERLPKNVEIKTIAEIICQECKERVVGDPMGCQIAGYENGVKCLYQVDDYTVTHKNINPETGMPSMCIVWDGERGISGHIIYDNEELDIGIGHPVTQNDIPTFSLDDGIRFAEAMLKKSCERLDDCGEPVFSLVITQDGLRWVHE